MEYIKELQEQGFEEKFVVDFLLGATNERKLTLNERAYVVKYYRNLEIALAECSHEEKAALPLQNVSNSVCASCGEPEKLTHCTSCAGRY